jgi:signal transduction histidine kinase
VQGAEVEFQVVDQGIGLPEQDIPRLFETFFRASNSGKISGTGLGLSIVKRAVELHGGRIAVTSQLGKGTTFTVVLPLQQKLSIQ